MEVRALSLRMKESGHLITMGAQRVITIGFLMTSLFLLLLITPGALLAGETLMLATTTSTDNTGLLDYLAPEFQRDTGIELRWVAVGTGRALKLGQRCDADCLLVHSPEDEIKFVKEGYGVLRERVMYNDFVIVGPSQDPAAIRGLPPTKAMKVILSKGARFASRGDHSGTHRKEISLWKAAKLQVPEKQKWYLETGQGMLATLRMAQELGCYTLTDRGTYLKYLQSMGAKPTLVILVEGYPELRNTYSVMAINPDRCKGTRFENARKFIQWITSKKAQSLIGKFKLFGKRLFVPDAR